jgi:hypothetical protein
VSVIDATQEGNAEEEITAVVTVEAGETETAQPEHGVKAEEAVVSAEESLHSSAKTGGRQSKTSQSERERPSTKSDSRAGSRGPSQTSKTGSKEVEKSASGRDKSRGASSKMSARTHGTKSRSKEGETGSRLSANVDAQSTVASKQEHATHAQHQWDEEEEKGQLSQREGEGVENVDDYKPPSTPSSGTEGDAKLSGETRPRLDFALSVEGTQLISPPDSSSHGQRTRQITQGGALSEREETKTIGKLSGV